MSEEQDEQLQLLREIRDNQQLQLSQQTESLAVQKKQFDLYFKQYEKTVQLQDRAERIQERSSDLVEKSRKLFTYLVPILLLLVIYLFWILF